MMGTSTPDRAAEALHCIPCPHGRDEWVKTLMACKAAGVDEDTARAWSEGGDNYNARSFADTWRSIKEGGGITDATLFHQAREHGWQGQAPDADELARMRQAAAQRAEQEAQRTAERRARAAVAAANLWKAGRSASGHPYLASKGVQAVDTLKQLDAVDFERIAGYAPASGGSALQGPLLLAPIMAAGKLSSVEAIDAQGRKHALSGGAKAGGYWLTGKLEGAQTLLLGEGVATALSASQCAQAVAAAAFSNTNLKAVALALKKRCPAARLVLLADLDKATGQPDAKAVEAANEAGAMLAVPLFQGERPGWAKDFNDLHQIEGPEAVRRCIEAACQPEQAQSEGWQEWEEPAELPNDLPPVAAFEADLLPEALRGFVLDIAKRMQCPPDYPAAGLLVALSSVIGARNVVAPKQRDDWRVVPNLWGMIVGRPGVMKSPALMQSLKLLEGMEATAREQQEAAHQAWQTDCQIAEMTQTANRKKACKLVDEGKEAQARELLMSVAMPEEPAMRRYVVSDTSVEKLGELLAQNPWGLLAYRDELDGMVCGFDKQGQEGSRSFYLQAYDGNQGWTVDRIGRGTRHIKRVCLSMLGAIQPGKLHGYVRAAVSGGASDDGLLQRFGMLVWPDVPHGFEYVDAWPDAHHKQAARDVFERLANLQPASEDEPVVWHFSPAAQQLYIHWVTGFEKELRSGSLHPALESHLAKYRKLGPALALLFALIDTPDSEGNLIHERELGRALDWLEYLRTHARRLYAAAVTPETTGARQLLEKIKEGRLNDGFTPRQVAVKHWAGLDTAEAVRKAAGLLADYGWLRRGVIKSGDAMGRGRPSERYAIYPGLLKGGAA